MNRCKLVCRVRHFVQKKIERKKKARLAAGGWLFSVWYDRVAEADMRPVKSVGAQECGRVTSGLQGDGDKPK